MAIRAKLVGLANLQGSLRKVVAANRSGVQRAIALGAAQVQGAAQKGIQRGSRSGVVVTIGGKRHQRSAPGERPKTDTGRLANSVFAEFAPGGLEVDVGSDVGHAAPLEFGTKNMAARPWLQPAFDENKEKIRARVIKAIKAASRKARRK